MITLTNFLAQLYGFTLVAITFSLLLNKNYLKKLFSAIEDEKNLFCTGITYFVIGLSTLLTHNLWEKNWKTAITLLAWFFLLKGLFFLIFPEYSQKIAKKIENQEWISFALLAILFFGLILAYLGFTQ